MNNNKFIMDIINEYWHNMMIKFIDTQRNNNWLYNNVLEYIGEYIKPEERRKMIELFENCKCCNRHQIRRPTLSQYDKMFSGHYNDFIDDEDVITDNEVESIIFECECICRHASRTLCEVNNLTCMIINDDN